MESVPPDVLRLTLGYLDDENLANACMVNKNFSDKVCNANFWLSKIINRFGLSNELINENIGNNSYWAYYFYLAKQADRAPDNILRKGIIDNRSDLIFIGLNMGADPSNGLVIAARQNNIKVAKMLLNEGADINANDGLPLNIAVVNNHPVMTEFLLEKGANPSFIIYLPPNNVQNVIDTYDQTKDHINYLISQGKIICSVNDCPTNADFMFNKYATRAGILPVMKYNGNIYVLLGLSKEENPVWADLGGRQDPGETTIEIASREFREEARRVLDIDWNNIEKIFITPQKDREGNQVLFMLSFDPTSSNININEKFIRTQPRTKYEDEMQYLQWIPLKEMKNIPNLSKSIEQILPLL